MGKPDADVNFDKAYGDIAVVHIITPEGVTSKKLKCRMD